MILVYAFTADTAAVRLGRRALLHVSDRHKRIVVPVAPVSSDFMDTVGVKVVNGDRISLLPKVSLFFGEDACGKFVFPPPLPMGADSVKIESGDGEVLSETTAPIPPDSWWPDLVARAATVAGCQ